MSPPAARLHPPPSIQAFCRSNNHEAQYQELASKESLLLSIHLPSDYVRVFPFIDLNEHFRCNSLSLKSRRLAARTVSEVRAMSAQPGKHSRPFIFTRRYNGPRTLAATSITAPTLSRVRSKRLLCGLARTRCCSTSWLSTTGSMGKSVVSDPCSMYNCTKTLPKPRSLGRNVFKRRDKV